MIISWIWNLDLFLEDPIDFILFSIKNYPPLALKLKWTIYKIIQYYNEYCIAMSNDCSQIFLGKDK